MKDPKRYNALDIWYIKLLRLLLMPIGGWPNLKQVRKKSVLSVQNFYLIIQLITVIGEITYLHDIFGVVDFFLVGDVYITTFFTLLSMTRLSLFQFKSYDNIIENFVLKFHLVYFKYEGETFQKIGAKINKISHYFTLYMCALCIMGGVLFNVPPMYVNFINGAFTKSRHNLDNITLEFSIRYKYPGYDQREKFFVTTIVNFYLSYICTLSITSIDLLLILTNFQIVGHLDVLARNMTSITKPNHVYVKQSYLKTNGYVYENEIYSEEENIKINKMLHELIEHHKFIISFTEQMSSCFGPVLGGTYMFHLASCCLLLLECSRGEPGVLIRFGPLTAVVFMQLIQNSVSFEIVGHKSELLADCVYNLPWQCMNVKNQKIVCIMLCRTQRPIRIVACGLVGVGVKTMANILKTTFSYYTFLRSL